MSRRLALIGTLGLVGAGLGLVGPASPSAMAAPSCAVAAHPGGEWRSYGHDADNTRNQPDEHEIGPLQAAQLEPVWTLSTTAAAGPSAGDVTGTPVIADGCLFVGTNGGAVIAANADTGEVVWATELPGGGGINSSVTVTDGRVFAGVSRSVRGGACAPNCGGSYVAALDQLTGAVEWESSPLDLQPGSDLFGSPVVHDGVVLAGISGGAAELGGEDDRYAFQGSMSFLDADSGAIVHKEWTIHAPATEPGGYEDDFAGGAIWSTPAVVTLPDGRTIAYVGVGNPFKPQAEHENTNSVVGFDLTDGSPTWGTIIGSYKGQVDEFFPGLSELPCVDIEGNPPPWYPQGGGSCTDVDLDFGASPNVFTDPTTGRLVIGAGQKSGVYHVFDAETFAPVHSSLVGPPSSVGGIVGSTAFDGSNIYGPVTLGGYLWSIDRDGVNRWATPTADGAHWGNPVAAANGVVYTVDLKGFLDAYDAATGAPLLHRPLHAGSGIGFNLAATWGGVSVARNKVYAAVGITGLPSGFVVAFAPSGQVSAPDVPSLEASSSGTESSSGALPNAQAVAGPGAFLTNFATFEMVAPAGSAVTLHNYDVAYHDFDIPSHNIDSALIPLGESIDVPEVASLPAGSYTFICSIHRSMVGTLFLV